MSDTTIYQRPGEILQHLIRFDTTNPPGNEAPCIAWVDELLRAAGFETTIVGRTPERTNLVTRLKGRGDAPPLLLYGHVDVVPTAGQNWAHPPFGGDLLDGYIWGRGAVDMKGGDAMLIAAMLRAKAENTELPGDVILALVSDEEDGGAYGAQYLVDEHPGLLEGVKFALGEFGAYSLYIGDKRFYPIMLAEKRICSVRMTVRGPGGHGSMRHTGTAMSKLARVLSRMESRLPVRMTPVARAMIESLADAFDQPISSAILTLLDDTDHAIDTLGAEFPAISRTFDAIVRNTANPTIIHGGTRINVIPSEITVDIDCRLVPGVTDEQFLTELRAQVQEDVEFQVVRSGVTTPDADMTLYGMLTDVLKEADPEGIPMPYIVSGATDGRIFSKLGIQTYGFLPMLLPPDFNFATTIHAADERVPASAIEFGANAIFAAMQRFGV